jgi:hypothetical protein
MSMPNDDATVLAARRQNDWAAWIDSRVGAAIEQERNFQRDVIGGVVEEIGQRIDDDFATLRREIAAVRDAPPPLIAPPDRKLAAALTRVGGQISSKIPRNPRNQARKPGTRLCRARRPRGRAWHAPI